MHFHVLINPFGMLLHDIACLNLLCFPSCGFPCYPLGVQDEGH